MSRSRTDVPHVFEAGYFACAFGLAFGLGEAKQLASPFFSE